MKNNPQPKILFLLHLPPPVHGSTVVGKAIKDSILINGAVRSNYINILMSRSIIETGKPNIFKLLKFLSIWFKLVVELIINKPDICYLALTTMGTGFYKDVLLVALLRLFHVECVFHLHNKGVSIQNSSKFYNSLYKYVFRNSEVILLSELLYFDIQKFVLRSNIHICPNGIADCNLNLRVNSNNKLNECPNILYLSNLIESKGIYILLEACSILNEKGIKFKCNLIGGEGDISVEQLTDKITEKGLSLIVKYYGKKYDDEKNEYFSQADIFAFPTYYHNETFGLVNLEAMQYSIPVVSTFEGGIPDVIDDGITGFLVPQKDVRALADKLELLINDADLRNKMGKAGRIKYENEFTLERFENRMVTILKEVSSK